MKLFFVILFLTDLFSQNALEKISDLNSFSINQNENGIIWISGYNKVARYDGFRFETFHNDPSISGQKLIGEIRPVLFNDIFVYFFSNEDIIRFNIKDEKFSNFGIPNNKSIIKSAAILNNNYFLIGTKNNLLKFNSQNLIVDTLLSGHINKINKIGPERFYVQLSDYNNYIYNSKDNSIERLRYKDQLVQKAFYSSKSNFILKIGNKLILNDQIIYESELIKNIRKIDETVDSFVLINTKNGISLINKVTKKFSWLIHSPNSNNNYTRLFVDNKDIIWTSINSDIYKISSTKNLIDIHHKTKNQSIHTSKYLNNQVFLSEINNSLKILDLSNSNKVTEITSSIVNIINGYSWDGKKLWLAGVMQGIHSIDPEKNIIVDENKIIGINLLTNKIIFSISHDANNDMWIGTYTGLNRMNKDGTINQFLSDKDSLLSNNEIKSLKSINDEVWVGTAGGLSIFNVKMNKFVDLKEFSIQNESINEIYHNSNKAYISTHNGLYIFNIYSKKIEKFINRNNGLNNVSTQSSFIFEDILYIGTLDGLYVFNKEYHLVKNYDKTNGVTSASSLFEHKGLIYFIDKTSLKSLTPEFKLNSKEPNIEVTRLKIFSDLAPLEKSIFNTKSIELDYNQNYLTFEFAAMDFTEPSKNRYKYKMDGITKDWVDHGTNNSITFSYLNPGKYVFHVIGSNNDGVWSKEARSISIKINPPFYKSWWAYLIYFAVFFTILYQIFQRSVERERQIATQQRILLEAEKEKQKIKSQIASDLHDEVGSNLSSISLIAQTVRKRSQLEEKEAKRLDTVASIAKDSAQAIREIIWFINPDNDSFQELLYKIKLTTSTMLQEIEYSLKIEGKEDYISDIEFRRNLFLFYKETLQNIIKHSEASHIDIALLYSKDHLKLSVKDNGKGFDLSEKQNGNGLKNYHKRAESIQAKAEISSKIGKGTEIQLII